MDVGNAPGHAEADAASQWTSFPVTPASGVKASGGCAKPSNVSPPAVRRAAVVSALGASTSVCSIS